ncbi:MAG: hypothetical protein LQ342_003489 [Letrouitia transgressa]|nr:MAG: hypothetical protein LQ342_003489 [Letrouitia transgressa]
MSTNRPPLHLLHLPLELRIRIYTELLCPDPGKGHILYHDRRGRPLSFNIYPEILRTNKQICAEASDILYNSNVFKLYLKTAVRHQCTGGFYRDGFQDPQPLFRREPPYNGFESPISPQGLIFPRCLRRIRHLELVFASNSVWATGRGHPVFKVIFSHVAELVFEVLNCLIEEQLICAVPRTKTLKLIVAPDYFGNITLFQWGLRRSEEDMRKMRRMIVIMERLARSRVIRFVIGVKVETDEGDDEIDWRDIDFEDFKRL